MILECLIQRDGPTHLTLDKFNYCFKENPDFAGAVVCDVTNDAHAALLLATGMYRKYSGERPTVSPDPLPLTEDEETDDEGSEQTPEEIRTEGAVEAEPGEALAMTDEDRDKAVLDMAAANMSYTKIAEVVGKSKSWVANRLKILKKG
jgi:hypothetical protein